MKKRKFSNADPKATKRKLMAALCMLLISSILMATTSYAWLVLSVAPEVTGIATNVAANGSLEIALLNADTRGDLSRVPAGTSGQSLAQNKRTANYTWGNLVDLNDPSFGLNDIVLMPARLNIVENEGKYSVQNGMLSVPTYGFDGRIMDLTDNTVSAIKQDDGNFAMLGRQDYGVRAIGTSSTLTAQASALAMAKANVSAYTQNARTSAISAMSANGNDLLGLMIAYFANSGSTFDDADLQVVKNMIGDLKTSVNYIDGAMRQGLIAVAASQIGDEDTFETIRERINSGESMITMVDEVEGAEAEFVEEFKAWVTALESTQNRMNEAVNKANALQGGVYTWDEIKGVLTPLMDLNKVYINDTLFPDMGKDELSGLMGSEITMTLRPGSGVLADIADFVDNYTASFSAVGSAVTVETASTVEEARLLVLYAAISTLEPAAGNSESAEIQLSTTYGYALDLAFRTNAPASNLLLQTSGVQRIYSDSTAPSTMGDGSYMEFSSQDINFTPTQVVELMDAVRVAFVDDQNNILGIAKLNTSNRSIVDGVVSAPLYMYDFSLSQEAETLGALVMGERMKSDNVVTELQQNVAKAVTVLVWLDGDIVDNTKVASSAELSMAGKLNLQFASSANLVPMHLGELKAVVADKAGLEKQLAEIAPKYEAGQGTYTSASWNTFAAAYEHAVAIKDLGNASETQIYWASQALVKAEAALEFADLNTLKATVAEIREMMGQTEDPARYVLKSGDTYISADPYTMEQYDEKVGTIYRVDYNKNLRDEGNGLMTPIYTDESWTNLATALYNAESYLQVEGAIPVRDLDKAIMALDSAEKALEFVIFFEPYSYNGAIYYFAVKDAANTDTYGKWYDANFKRVISDLTILKLDAEAEKVEDYAELQINDYIPYNTTEVAPMVALNDALYPEIANEEILGVNWKKSGEAFTVMISQAQAENLKLLVDEAKMLEKDFAPDTERAEKMIAYADTRSGNGEFTHDEAAAEIQALAKAIKAGILAQAADADEKANEDGEPMTAELRNLLTKAVSSGKGVAGYEDTTLIKLDALRTAVKEAEEALAADGTDNAAAKEVLSALNAQLRANGITEVTAYNTTLIKLPTGSELFDLVYLTEDVSALLRVNAAEEEDFWSYEDTAMHAVIVTKNGVLTEVEHATTFYMPASDAAIVSEITAPDAEELKTWECKLAVGQSEDVLAQLVFAKDRAEHAAEKNILLENAYDMVWSSDDDKVVKVTDSGTVTAVGTGTTTIRVSITTVQGGVYTASVEVTIPEPAQEEPAEPTS